jgi:hypothetical protein
VTWILSDQEFEAVLRLPEARRYSYLIKKAADNELVWSLWTPDGWALSGRDDGSEMVPVWPHERFAEACASGAWDGYQPRSVPLDEWLEHWIAGMLRDKRVVSAFPSPSGKAVAVSPLRMKEDLETELEKYG